MCVLHDDAKQECENHGVWIRLKRRPDAISASRFVVDHTIEDATVCDAASRIAEAMAAMLTIHAAENVVEHC